MSTLANVDPKDLRPLVHEQIDRLTDVELETVRRTLLELEAKRLWQQMSEGAEQDRLAGKLDPDKVEEAIREHRARHPYR